ncbi:MAG: choice-of-anchor J domain-containing protein [Muribaculaceae bacterium]
MQSIGANAFENFVKVTELVIPNSVTTLSERAFKAWAALQTVTIGSGITTIKAYTFERDGNINNVIMKSRIPPTIEDQAFPVPFFITMTVPTGCKDAYQTAYRYLMFSSFVEDGTEVIDVPMPTISMDNDNMVTIECSDDRAEIYYTIGTASPTKSSTLYTAPFKLTHKDWVRARAFIDEFQSEEAHSYLEPREDVTIPEMMTVFINGHKAWGSSKRMAWHSYPVADDGESSRVSDVLGSACVWAEPCGDLLYMFNYDTYSTTLDYYLTTYDRGTLEFVGQEKLPDDFIANDLAVDPVTGNIYGMFTRNNEYYWGYINLEEKTRTNVAKYELLYRETTTVDRIMALCFNPEGVAYGLTFGGRLLKIDRESGSYEIVGETNWNINYVSCARWDKDSGKILYAFSDQDGKHYLYTIDPTTAERAKFAEVPGSISAFFTPLDYVNAKAPAIPTEVSLSFGEGSRTGKLTFKAPSVAQNGDEIDGELNYRVVRKGKTVAQGTVRAGAYASADITANIDGTVKYSVVLSNNYGESLRARVQAFAGIDTPATPCVRAERTTEGIKVTWDKVSTGVHGGYINADNVTYSVVRYPGKQTVASSLTDLEYIDNVEAPEEGKVKTYYYTVTAWASDAASEAATSNKVVLGYMTPTWTENFSTEESLDNFTIINNSGYHYDDEGDTSGWKWNNYWRSVGAFYHPYASLDDWLITPPLMMEKGKTYHVTFKAGSYPDRLHNYLEVAYGNDNSEAAMTNIVLEKFNVTSESQKGDWMTTYSADIIPQEDGLQYIGFHCLSLPDQLWLYLDDITVLEGVVAGAPKAVQDLTVSPDLSGNTTVSIAFAMPGTTVDEKEITGTLEAQIYRGEQLVYSATDLDKGASVSFVDEVNAHGNQTYEVLAVADGIKGMATRSTVFVGNSRPLAPENVSAVENAEKYGEVTITWDDPKADELGRAILPQTLTYDIEYAWDDGTTGILAEGIQGNSYTYAPKEPTDKEQFVAYQIKAHTPYGASNVATRTNEQIPVGAAYKAPWSESFTSPTTSPMGTSLVNGTINCGWGGYSDSDGINSQDGDGVFAGFRGVTQGNAGSLYTGKLDCSDVTLPVISYWVYKMGPEDVNTIEFFVGGFGQWESLDLTSMDQLDEGWNKIELPLDDYEGATIRLKWLATVNLYSYVLLDNVVLKSSVSGITDVTDVDAYPIRTQFYTIGGVEVARPAVGTPYVVVTTYSDGSRHTNKIVTK